MHTNSYHKQNVIKIIVFIMVTSSVVSAWFLVQKVVSIQSLQIIKHIKLINLPLSLKVDFLVNGHFSKLGNPLFYLGWQCWQLQQSVKFSLSAVYTTSLLVLINGVAFIDVYFLRLWWWMCQPSISINAIRGVC